MVEAPGSDRYALDDLIGERTKTGSSPKPQPRHSAPTTRFRARAFVALGVALAAVVGTVLFFVMRGNKERAIPDPTEIQSTTPAPGTPTFDFDVASVQGISASAEGEREAVDAVAEEAGDDIARLLSRMYSFGFLDRTNWQEGNYNEVYGYFTGDAQVAAQEEARSLTLGPNGGETYEDVPGASGTVKVKVLVDGDGNPATAIASTSFVAEAEAKDGKDTLLVSRGDFFMEATPAGWTIYGFDVDRFNQAAKPADPQGEEETAAPEETG